MGEPIVVGLDACAGLPVALIGGKARNLGRLRALGFPVPDGFVVTTAGHRAVAAGERERVEEAALAAYRSLGSPPVAVRSSAVVEDRDEASLAGQLETCLGVAGEEALLEAVAAVEASSRSERVAAYVRERGLGIDPAQSWCAVVVQPMLSPDTAGVAFTVDPLSGQRDRVAIEAAPGSGEAVVSGTVQPERLVLSRPGLAIVERRTYAERQLLDDRAARAVAEVALEIEERLGGPQDVEWALVGRRVWVLQARPITTLVRVGPPDAGEVVAEEIARLRRAHGDDGVWINTFAAELIPEPTVATLEIARMAASPGGGLLLERQLDLGLPRARHALGLDTICARLYIDFGSLETIVHDWGIPLRLAPPTAGIWWRGVGASWFLLDPRRLWLLPRLIVRLPVIGHRARRLVASAADQFWNEDLPIIEHEVGRAAALDLESLDDDALLAELDVTRDWLAGPARRIWERGAHAGLMTSQRLAIRTRLLAGDRDRELATALVRGAPHNATLEANDAACRLAETVRRHGESSERFAAALDDFLARYGHRSTSELELAEPRWVEDPDSVRAMVAAIAESSGEPVPPPVPAELLAGLGRLRRFLLRRAVERARRNQFLRETPKFHFLRRYAQLRALYMEIGRRAVARGRLERPDDVFHLTRSELFDALATRDHLGIAAVAGERRRRREVLRTIPLPPILSLAGIDTLVTTAPHLVSDERRGVLRGDPVSPGVVTGDARVVHDPTEATTFGPDTVLVAPRTDPAWTTLFPGVRAIVTETGSTVSHSAIIAREYGLPMVVNVARATTLISDGARVTVDGAAGLVRLSPSAEPTGEVVAPGAHRGDERIGLLDGIAPVWRRLVGFLLDDYLFFPLVVLVSWLAPDGNAGTVCSITVVLANGLVAVALWGRTLGMWLMGVRVVVPPDRGSPGWRPAGARWVVLRGPRFALQVAVLLAHGALGWAGALEALWLVIVLVPLLADPYRRGLHDRAAGTVVVRADLAYPLVRRSGLIAEVRVAGSNPVVRSTKHHVREA